VIRYNIESHVAFAADVNGNIFPNSRFAGAEWSDKDGRYGGHVATCPSRGGYTLTIGAKAFLKTVYRYGDNEKVEYEYYYKGGSHLKHDNPAELLNSWTSFSLGDGAKEIPYSDEAALFFHDLMLGMAKLSKLVQDNTFDQSGLSELIESGSRLLSFDEKSA
jgi:hypothetical protein